MRKSILCVILGCFFSILCHGQVSFGVNASITSSTLSEKLAKSKTFQLTNLVIRKTITIFVKEN